MKALTTLSLRDHLTKNDLRDLNLKRDLLGLITRGDPRDLITLKTGNKTMVMAGTQEHTVTLTKVQLDTIEMLNLGIPDLTSISRALMSGMGMTTNIMALQALMAILLTGICLVEGTLEAIMILLILLAITHRVETFWILSTMELEPALSNNKKEKLYLVAPPTFSCIRRMNSVV
jgi:hypothetical protein